MTELYTPHNESLMLMVMGSPYRVPNYAYPNWRLIYVSERAALDAYREEWANGTEAQLTLVSRATEEAGLGNYPQLLRQKAAEVTAKLLGHHSGPVLKILDIGSGPGLSVLAVYEALPLYLKRIVNMFLLEPSAQSMQKGGAVMENNGVKYNPLWGIDLNIPQQLIIFQRDIKRI